MSAESTHFDLERYDNAYPPGIENNYWHVARNRVIASLLPRASLGPILEIGCGPGIVVEFLREAGWDCWGCDLGDARPVSEAVLPFLKLQRDAFDLDAEFRASVKTLLLLDVLEHLSDPADFLRQCRAAFQNLERVVITLPARQELWSIYDEYFGHFLRYDLPGARALLEQSGFAPRSLRYFFHFIYLPMRLLSLLRLQRSIKNLPPSGALARFVHRVLGFVFFAESKLMPGIVPGSSISAVATVAR